MKIYVDRRGSAPEGSRKLGAYEISTFDGVTVTDAAGATVYRDGPHEDWHARDLRTDSRLGMEQVWTLLGKGAYPEIAFVLEEEERSADGWYHGKFGVYGKPPPIPRFTAYMTPGKSFFHAEVESLSPEAIKAAAPPGYKVLLNPEGHTGDTQLVATCMSGGKHVMYLALEKK